MASAGSRSRLSSERNAGMLDEAHGEIASTPSGNRTRGLMQAVSKPRKAVIQRDPRTGRVIGAMSVRED